ncbi:MAG: tetratricopeptide repeat protein [Myxococcota bacterium]|nr:tetratricopeptide repeat protein [Myxococcota bacterium]
MQFSFLRWGPWALSLGLMAAVAALPSSAQSQGRALDTIMAEAVEAREAGDTQRVVKLLQEAYAVEPAPQLLNNLGKVYEQIGAYRQAYAAYQKVANDPTAPQDLRALDTARLNGLRPKLNDAWLKPEVKPPNATVRVDGEEVELDVDGEAKLRKGRHAVQFTGADGATTALRFVDTPVGQRTTVTEDLMAPNPLGGAISLEGVGDGLSSLSMNGAAVGGDLGALRTILAEPGTYAFSLKRGEETWTAEVSPGPGETLSLKDHLVATATAAAAPVESAGPNNAIHAQSAPTGGLPMGAVITTGAGVVTAIVGGVLLSMGNSERDGLPQAAQAAPNQQAARQVLIDGNEKADSLESMGAAALGVGAAAAAGGLVWWVLSPADDDASALNESTPRLHLTAWGRGLLISGSF